MCASCSPAWTSATRRRPRNRLRWQAAVRRRAGWGGKIKGISFCHGPGCADCQCLQTPAGQLSAIAQHGSGVGWLPASRCVTSSAINQACTRLCPVSKHSPPNLLHLIALAAPPGLENQHVCDLAHTAAPLAGHTPLIKSAATKSDTEQHAPSQPATHPPPVHSATGAAWRRRSCQLPPATQCVPFCCSSRPCFVSHCADMASSTAAL